MKSFDKLDISSEMQNNLKTLKYLEMTPIQESSIPEILQGHDIMAQAKTGSGKTAAFGIGLLHKLKVEKFRVQSLVLCPTRELAEQVTAELRKLARFKHNIKLLKLTGGMPLYKQEHSLSHEAHIVVGTPGRILKLLQRGSLNFDNLKTVVLDEADRMLDMGFINEVEDILSFTSKKIQMLCYSATYPDEIKKFCSTFLENPKEITVDSEHDQDVIEQHFIHTDKSKKSKMVVHLLNQYKPESVIVFCNTKDECRRLSSSLTKEGIHTLSLHGDLEQRDRTDVIIRFSNKSCRILIATDVAARGLDIDNLSAVINYNLPFETETYIHRIGRTGRAGKEGVALSIFLPGEGFRLEGINEYQGSDLKPEHVEIDETVKTDSFEAEMVTVSINGGRKNKISAGDILGALTKDGELAGSDIGKIDRLDFLTFVAIKSKFASLAFDILDQRPIKGKRFKVVINDNIV